MFPSRPIPIVGNDAEKTRGNMRLISTTEDNVGPLIVVTTEFLTLPLPKQILAQRRNIDHEPVAHVAPHHPLPRLVHLLNGRVLDVGGDPALAAEVEHLLGLLDPADPRPG